MTAQARLAVVSLAGLAAIVGLWAAMSCARAQPQQGKLEEAIMAVPVTSLAFSMNYLADDLNLWGKHRRPARSAGRSASALATLSATPSPSRSSVRAKRLLC